MFKFHLNLIQTQNIINVAAFLHALGDVLKRKKNLENVGVLFNLPYVTYL